MPNSPNSNTGAAGSLTFREFLRAPFSDISVDKAGGFLHGNFFFLVWILVVPLLMFGMKQGWELLYGLFDDVGFYPGFRAAAMLFAYFLLAMAIWLLPLPFFRKINPDTAEGMAQWNRLRPVTANNPYRGLLVSSLPMIFYSVVMIIVQAIREVNGWYLALTIVTIAGGIVLMWWVMERSKLKVGLLMDLMIATWGMVFVSIWIGKETRTEVFWNYYFVGLGMSIQMALLGGIFKHLESRLGPNGKPGLNRTHRRYYRFVFFTVVIGTLVLSMVNNLHFLTPTFVLLFIITFYLLLNDLVIALYILIKKKEWVNWAMSIALVVLVWFIFVHRSEIHNINYVESSLPAESTRVGFDKYFKHWYKNNIAPYVDTASTEPIPLYLVAAQGGGSRAGLWTSEILNRFEVESGYKFHRHVFAITSASGGSVGAGSTLSLWRYVQDHPALDDSTKKRLHLYFGAQMFQRNYLSSQFMQLFVNEVGKRFVCLFKKKDVYDRNLEHQLHETLGFANAVRFGHEPGDKNDLSPFERIGQAFLRGSGDSLSIGKKRPKIPNYPMQPYLSNWYTPTGQLDTRLPLYFPITLNIQTGKPGYASPITWDDGLFIDAVDLIGEAEKRRPGHSLALVTTTNLSQLFPAMNSYTYMDGVGNFMDGGLFENMGLTLMTRIHARLSQEIADASESLIPSSVKKRLKIKVLFLINDEIRTPSDKTFDRFNQIMATLRAVSSASIQGRNTWWLDYYAKQLPKDEKPIEFVLQDHHTPPGEQVPLGRWLSERSVDSVCARVRRLSEEKEQVLQGLR